MYFVFKDHVQTVRSLFWIVLIGSYISAILPQEMALTIGHLSDKWTHFLAFSVLTVLLRLAYCVSMVQTSLLLFAYGVFIEVSQYFTPNRSAEVLDVIADVIGIGLGLIVYNVLQRVSRVPDEEC
jgi:VanZ family protein